MCIAEKETAALGDQPAFARLSRLRNENCDGDGRSRPPPIVSAHISAAVTSLAPAGAVRTSPQNRFPMRGLRR